MQKTFLVIFLLVLIFSSLIFILFYYSFNLSDGQNFLNQKFRLAFASNLKLRRLFKLHQIGDARSDYLSSKNFKSLKITVFTPYRNPFSEDFKKTLTERLNQILDKPEGIFIQEKSIDLIENLTDEGIKFLIRNNFPNFKNSAQINIFLVKNYAEFPTNVGLVKDAYHIFLFTRPLEEISHFEKNTDNIYLSTILHEVAHLLGAGHVKKEGCILSEKVEDIAFGRPAKISTAFCPEDLEEIKKILLFFEN